MPAENPLATMPRRKFLRRALALGIVANLPLSAARARAAKASRFEAGEGRVDISPPTGITLGGFHYSSAKPRLITGLRQAPAARALVLRVGQQQAAIISFDMLNVSRELAQRVQRRVAKEARIPARHVRVCATHSHTMPSIAFNRQWGDQHPAYFRQVEDKLVEAVRRAQDDLAPAELFVGRGTAAGASFNRTTPKWKTDAEFTRDATDADRWLDTKLHALHFERRAPKRPLLWYNFSAHPVCYTDTLAGPDWPGLVEELARAQNLPPPSFLQGHIGDVNPGRGSPWLGKAEETAPIVLKAMSEALANAVPVPVRELRIVQTDFPLPLDLALFQSQIARYRSDPAKCASGEWVDAAFARDWFVNFAAKCDLKQIPLPSSLAAMRLGEVGLLFHGAELYSYYGLAIQRDSALPHTIVVGYADGYVGYLPDPSAFKNGEYSALVVPKILNHAPFAPTAARDMTRAALALLSKLSHEGRSSSRGPRPPA